MVNTTSTMHTTASQTATPRPVWDLAQRLAHWTLALAFALAWLTAESERWRLVHVASGLTVMGVVMFRVLWGLVGSGHARFADFVTGPARVVGYLRSLLGGRPEHHTGHNPAGGWAVLGLLSLALTTAVLGGLTYHEPGGCRNLGVASEKGPQRGQFLPDSQPHSPAMGQEDGEKWAAAVASQPTLPKFGSLLCGPMLEEAHEVLATLALGLVGVHVLGVVVSSLLHHENLVRAMLTGRKQAPATEAPAHPAPQGLALNLAGLALLAACVGLSIWWGW